MCLIGIDSADWSVHVNYQMLLTGWCDNTLICRQEPFSLAHTHILNTHTHTHTHTHIFTHEVGGKYLVNLVTFALSRKTGLKFMCQVEKQGFCDKKIKIYQDVEGVRRSLIAHYKVQIIRNTHCEKIGKCKCN